MHSRSKLRWSVRLTTVRVQEARRRRFLLMHTMLPKAARNALVSIAALRDTLLLDTDLDTLAWLRDYNPVLCTSSAGEASVVLTKEPGRQLVSQHALNAPTVSRFILDKADGMLLVPRVRRLCLA